MKNKNSMCLVLNADYTPLNTIIWKRALLWSIKHEHNPKLGIEILDFYKDDYILGANNKKIPVPAVARRIKYIKMNQQEIKFSRKNVFIRDNYGCQYCGQFFDPDDLTYDHVIPKSKWHGSDSPTSWTNIVTCCEPCNKKKGNKTVQQANMTLRSIPSKPDKTQRFLRIYDYLDTIRDRVPEEWKIYVDHFTQKHDKQFAL